MPPDYPFDDETWAALPSYFAELPNPVHISLWGDPQETVGEHEAVRLCEALADTFEPIQFTVYPRRVNYNFYPVIGVMGLDGDQQIDYGVRIIGRPSGYQLTSLIAAIQVVAFRGVTLEPRTRVQLRGLSTDVAIEIMTDADDEVGALVAKHAFGLSVASDHVRTWLVMADVFPEALIRYSVTHVPHTVINSRYHVSGALSEEDLLIHIAKTLQTQT